MSEFSTNSWSRNLCASAVAALLIGAFGCGGVSEDTTRLDALNMTGVTTGPTMRAPSVGSVLKGTDVTFRWDENGEEVFEWDLNLSAANYVFRTGWTEETSKRSILVRGLPTHGGPLKARLWFRQRNGWNFKDFKYTTANKKGETGPEDPSTPPNVVLIVADDLGYGEMGAYRQGQRFPSKNECGSTGQRFINTPNMDALAARGARFTNGYATAAICNASRTGIQTGRYQQDFGVYWYGVKPTVPGEPTLGRFMKGAGHRTGYIGKVHDAAAARGNPRVYGFDEFFGFFGHSHDYEKIAPGQSSSSASIVKPLIRNNSGPAGVTGYITKVFADEAADFIDAQGKDPYFLQVAFNAVHTPITKAPTPYKRRYGITRDLEYPDWDPNETSYTKYSQAWHRNRKTDSHARQRLLSVLDALDDSVGQIIDALRRNGVYRNTMVILTSDNGGGKFNCANNGPLNGFKFSLSEGGIRVPFLVSWPAGGIAPNQVVETPVTTLDIFPTMVASVQGQQPAGRDGANLLPMLRGKRHQLGKRNLFWHQKAGGYFASCTEEEWAVREGDWKLLRNCEGTKLFNLRDDPGEQIDLSGSRPARVSRMKASFKNWSANL